MVFITLKIGVNTGQQLRSSMSEGVFITLKIGVNTGR